MNGEDSISTCTLFGVRWMLGDTLLCSTGNCLGSCDDLEGGMRGEAGGLGGRVCLYNYS